MARAALHQRIAERADVARRDPDLGVHQDPCVEADDVVALLDHRSPPRPLDVVLQLHAQRPVVPDGVDATVDLGLGKTKPRRLARQTIVSRFAMAGAAAWDSGDRLGSHGRHSLRANAGPRSRTVGSPSALPVFPLDLLRRGRARAGAGAPGRDRPATYPNRAPDPRDAGPRRGTRANAGRAPGRAR